MLNIKAGFKVTTQHTRSQALQLYASCSSFLKQSYHFFKFNTCFMPIYQCFTHSNNIHSIHNLVCSFCVLARSCLSHMLNFLRITIQNRLCLSKSLYITSNHRHKISVPRSDFTTRHRSIDETYLLFESFFMNSHSLTRIACGMINQNSTFFHVMQQPCFIIEYHVFNIMRVPYHHEYDI